MGHHIGTLNCHLHLEYATSAFQLISEGMLALEIEVNTEKKVQGCKSGARSRHFTLSLTAIIQ